MAMLEATHALTKQALGAAEQEARAAKEEAGHASAELAKVLEGETGIERETGSHAPPRPAPPAPQCCVGCEPLSAWPVAASCEWVHAGVGARLRGRNVVVESLHACTFVPVCVGGRRCAVSWL